MEINYPFADTIYYHPIGPFLSQGTTDWEIRKLTKTQ
jgi:hypothetical protein